MKKVLLCFVLCGVVTVTHAQEEISFENLDAETLRARIMEQTGDFKIVSATDDHAVIDVSNPYGIQKARIDVRNKSEDEGGMVIHDLKTGRVIGSASGKKDEYMKLNEDFPNRKVDLDLRRTGAGEDDISGTIKYKSTEETLDLKITNGQPTGTIRQLENGYEQVITMYSDGSAKLQVNDPKTHKTLYTAQGTEERMKVFDSNGKLIAEGSEDNMKVYDRQAFKKYEKMTEDSDD